MSNSTINLNGVIIKVASRCNLNCSYCYMYNLGDSTYKNQPKVMKDRVVDALIDNVLNYCLAAHRKWFMFIFHGGEPLLAKQKFFENFVSKCNAKLLPAGITPLFDIQTNGTLLTPEWCQTFKRLGVKIGISLDGTKAINDKFRLDHHGKSSYSSVLQGLEYTKEIIPEKKTAPLLAVIDIDSDPIECYEHFKSLNTRKADFLLPDSHYDCPPPLPKNNPTAETPYGDWLIKMFDRWFEDNNNTRLPIRTFKELVQIIIGGKVNSDVYGSNGSEVLVIETDGGIEATDSLKTCGNGFTKANMNVLDNSFDEAAKTPLASLYNQAHHKLCKKCQDCPVSHICGGGFIVNRYSSDNGFDNPTIYCRDLAKLITHIQDKVLKCLPTSMIDELKLKRISYKKLQNYLNKNAETRVLKAA